MNSNLRERLVRLLLIVGSLSMAACGGGDDGGETVTGDSPEGVPLDQLVPENPDEQEGEAVPLGPSGVEPEEFGNDDSPTDGQ